MINLHIHSNYSDGSYPVQKVAELLKETGIKVAALTDHDTVKGVKLFQDIGKKNGIVPITGVEISSKINEKLIHILGYNIDLNNKELNKALDSLSESRLERADGIIKKANELGLKITKKETQELAGNDEGNIGKPHIAKILIKNNKEKIREILKKEPDLDNVINVLFERDGLLYVEKLLLPYEETISLIKNAGGKAVLAHPNYKLSYEELLKYLPLLVKEGLYGLETFFSNSTKTDTTNYLNLANEYKLITTIGSDFHGSDRKRGLIISDYYGFDKEEIQKRLIEDLLKSKKEVFC